MSEPAWQRSDEGIDEKVPPFDAPHLAYFLLSKSEAEHLSVTPPLNPEQDQYHGPVPVTILDVPALQSPSLGTVESV
jgi:hypothetical protein